MSKLTIFILLISALLSCSDKRKTGITLHLIGSTASNPELHIGQTTYPLELDASGKGLLSLEQEQQGYASLKLGKERIPLYIEPGKSFTIYIYGNHACGNARFEGKGASKNIYLQQEMLNRPQLNYELEEQAFLQQLDEHIARKFHLVDSLQFDALFSEIEKKRIRFSTYSALENYPLYHAWSTGNKEYTPDSTYLNRVRSLIIEDESLMELEEYKTGIASLVYLISTYNQKEYNAYKQLKAQTSYVLENMHNPTLKEFLINRFTYNYLMGAGIDEHTGEVVEIFNTHVRDTAYRSRFFDCYRRSLRIAEGQPSCDFTFTDKNGRAYHLKDFEGQYLFLNIWTTWGLPCRTENISWEKLAAQFKDKNIQFVSVSCDKERSVWERTIRKDSTLSRQLYMGKDESFQDFYMIRGVPRFILIDPRGNIIGSDMPRPSDPAATCILQQLLKDTPKRR